MSDRPGYDLDRLRARIPLLATTVPMNACSQAPQTTDTRAAAERYLDSWAERGMDWDLWIGEVERARDTFARMIGADGDEVAVFTSVSHATAALASALETLEGAGGGRRTVALTAAEFPTVAHVWKAAEARGRPLRWIDLRDGVVSPEALEAGVDEDVLLLSASWGYYQNGAVLDLDHLVSVTREAGALLYLDAYQVLGTRPLDVKAAGVDMLASGNLKFLLGIPGIAFLYVRRELAERMEPGVTGWFGRADPFAFRLHRDGELDWGPGARRFDGGTPPVLPAYVARAGMEILLDLGLEHVHAWTRTLAGRLAEGGIARGLELLGPRDPARRAPTTAFRVPEGFPGGSHGVEEAMRERGFLPSARGSAIRLAPHAYSTTDEVDAALDAVAEVLGKGS